MNWDAANVFDILHGKRNYRYVPGWQIIGA